MLTNSVSIFDSQFNHEMQFLIQFCISFITFVIWLFLKQVSWEISICNSKEIEIVRNLERRTFLLLHLSDKQSIISYCESHVLSELLIPAWYSISKKNSSDVARSTANMRASFPKYLRQKLSAALLTWRCIQKLHFGCYFRVCLLNSTFKLNFPFYFEFLLCFFISFLLYLYTNIVFLVYSFVFVICLFVSFRFFVFLVLIQLFSVVLLFACVYCSFISFRFAHYCCLLLFLNKITCFCWRFMLFIF